jgi:hypothetical protein
MRAVVLGLVAILAALTSGCAPCANRVAREVASPTGAYKAVVFERDCGATTDFSTQISVLEAGKKLGSKPGNVFVADSNRGRVPVDVRGLMSISVSWKSASQVEIGYPPGARIFLQAPTYQSVQVSYKSN